MKKFYFLLILLISHFRISRGQNLGSEAYPIKSHRISLSYYGVMPLGIYCGQMVTERISYELGVGIFGMGTQGTKPISQSVSIS